MIQAEFLVTPAVKKAAAIARKDALIAVISRPIVCLLVAEREELFLIEGLTHRGKVSFYCGNRSSRAPGQRAPRPEAAIDPSRPQAEHLTPQKERPASTGTPPHAPDENRTRDLRLERPTLFATR